MMKRRKQSGIKYAKVTLPVPGGEDKISKGAAGQGHNAGRELPAPVKKGAHPIKGNLHIRPDMPDTTSLSGHFVQNMH
jgi:hypothetical protein